MAFTPKLYGKTNNVNGQVCMTRRSEAKVPALFVTVITLLDTSTLPRSLLELLNSNFYMTTFQSETYEIKQLKSKY